MAEGRAREAWQHTASLMALVVNCLTSKGKTAKPEDFYPFPLRGRPRQAEQPIAEVGIEVLKDVFINQQWPKIGDHECKPEPQEPQSSAA